MKFLVVLILLLPRVMAGQPLQVPIIPRPQNVWLEEHSEGFIITPETKIVVDSPVAHRAAESLIDSLHQLYGFRLGITTDPRTKSAIFIGLGDTKVASPEAYAIRAVPWQVFLTGGGRGLFYAVQSLLQLLSPLKTNRSLRVPKVDIYDAPRFPYRGMHLDVSRHFMPVEFVKKYIDLMAQYKFNYFHWHLTDDQGWRIEIKKYPRLTDIGSTRPQSQLGEYTTTFHGDGIPVSGFYTQEQIREVVAYAKARYITVIPEIEMPGHSSAVLAAYPELSCKPDQKYHVQMTWGTFREVYCPTETTFKFLEDVLSEVIDLFPDSPYIHIGGDEVIKDMWKDSPVVKTLMEREHLK
ncbi:MAG: family 20 glycosylhydrolase, partial [Acidobacteria bacterium]|nr:family 20 glycosylhydrolase [Acidobacteriota bacterium]